MPYVKCKQCGRLVDIAEDKCSRCQTELPEKSGDFAGPPENCAFCGGPIRTMDPKGESELDLIVKGARMIRIIAFFLSALILTMALVRFSFAFLDFVCIGISALLFFGALQLGKWKYHYCNACDIIFRSSRKLKKTV